MQLTQKQFDALLLHVRDLMVKLHPDLARMRDYELLMLYFYWGRSAAPPNLIFEVYYPNGDVKRFAIMEDIKSALRGGGLIGHVQPDDPVYTQLIHEVSEDAKRIIPRLRQNSSDDGQSSGCWEWLAGAAVTYVLFCLCILGVVVSLPVTLIGYFSSKDRKDHNWWRIFMSSTIFTGFGLIPLFIASVVSQNGNTPAWYNLLLLIPIVLSAIPVILRNKISK